MSMGIPKNLICQTRPIFCFNYFVRLVCGIFMKILIMIWTQKRIITR